MHFVPHSDFSDFHTLQLASSVNASHLYSGDTRFKSSPRQNIVTEVFCCFPLPAGNCPSVALIRPRPHLSTPFSLWYSPSNNSTAYGVSSDYIAWFNRLDFLTSCWVKNVITTWVQFANITKVQDFELWSLYVPVTFSRLQGWCIQWRTGDIYFLENEVPALFEDVSHPTHARTGQTAHPGWRWSFWTHVVKTP